MTDSTLKMLLKKMRSKEHLAQTEKQKKESARAYALELALRAERRKHVSSLLEEFDGVRFRWLCLAGEDTLLALCKECHSFEEWRQAIDDFLKEEENAPPAKSD